MSNVIEILDALDEPKNVMNFGQRDSIAFLLGAGFSIPMGYPTGSDVNRGILNFYKQPVTFTSAGELFIDPSGSKSDFGYTNHWDKEYCLCNDLIAAYSKKVDKFDYEQFMDLLRSKSLYTEYASIFSKYQVDTQSPYYPTGNLPDIYSQMVAYLLKDVDNKTWYEEMPNQFRPHPNHPRSSYNNFLQYLSRLKDTYVVNIHTLNHDLLFESFSRSDYINGDISDGFDDHGSRYYGKLRLKGSDIYRCRLERYTGRYYGKSIRLYKLHGSLNYAMMHRDSGYGLVDDCEVKLREKIGLMDLERERSKHNGYDNDFTLYHADFLTGATTKTLYYRSSFYKKLFQKYKNNLIQAKALIVIGYGGKDEGINDYLLNYFDFHNKPCYFIDPGISRNEQLLALANKMNATKIEKSISDFDCSSIHF